MASAAAGAAAKAPAAGAAGAQGVATLERIKSRASVLLGIIGDIEQSLQKSNMPLFVMVEGPKHQLWNDDNVPAKKVKFVAHRRTAAYTPSEGLLNSVAAHIRPLPRLFMESGESRLEPIKKWKDVEKTIKLLVDNAQFIDIEMEDSPVRVRTKAFESVVECLVHVEEELGGFHATLLGEADKERLTGLVKTINDAVQEIGKFTLGFRFVKV